MNEKREVISAKEAAHRMGRRPDNIMAWMRKCAMENRLCPIGMAIPPIKKGGCWSYVIPRARFESFMSGGGEQ